MSPNPGSKCVILVSVQHSRGVLRVVIRLCSTNNQQHVTYHLVKGQIPINIYLVYTQILILDIQLFLIVLQFSLSKLKICVLKSIYHSLKDVFHHFCFAHL